MTQDSQVILDRHLKEVELSVLIGNFHRLSLYTRNVTMHPYGEEFYEPDPGLHDYTMFYNNIKGPVHQVFAVIPYPSNNPEPASNEQPVHLTVHLSGYCMVEGVSIFEGDLLEHGRLKSKGRLTLGGKPITWKDLKDEDLASMCEWLQEQNAQMISTPRPGEQRPHVQGQFEALLEQVKKVRENNADDVRLHFLEMVLPALEDLLSREPDEAAFKALNRRLLRIQLDIMERFN